MLDEFTSLDPNALEVPVLALVDGDLKLCQSGSILLHLAEKFGKMDDRRGGCCKGR